MQTVKNHHKQDATECRQAATAGSGGCLPQQVVWLSRIADLLDSTPDHLLASGMIDSHDLVELLGTNPQSVANLIRATYAPSSIHCRQTWHRRSIHHG